jgi:hypothetical protein
MARKQVEAVEGFGVWLDSGTDTYARFEADGAAAVRHGYGTGYVFPAGTTRVKVTPGDDYVVTVRPWAAAHQVTVTPGTTRAQLAALLTDDTDVTWAPGAVTTLDRVLEIRHRNVRFLRPALRIAPAPGRQAGIHVRAAGFRVEDAAVRGAAGAGGTGKLAGCDLFHVRAGGSLVCRGGRFTRINTFLHVEAGHGGVAIERPALDDLRAYAMYANGGDAGISWAGGTVTGPGNEPFFRCMERDAVRHPTRNVYVGHVHMTRTGPSAVGKDGITPRGVRRFAADSCVLERCQFRSGQDRGAAAEGDNPDPEDVLLFGCTITHAYAEHKKGSGLGARIHMVGNTFISPVWKPPIGLGLCAGAVVKDNRWRGAPPGPWKVRRAHGLADLVESNNVGEPGDVPERGGGQSIGSGVGVSIGRRQSRCMRQ